MLDAPIADNSDLNDLPIDEQQRREALEDFRICHLSREISILSRREVLTGKAKFGITGDGKEVPQAAMARAFRRGDFRSGYYRDQTFMLALGLCSAQDLFAQLYADAANDPFSGGRQMNNHFATPLVDAEGQWTDHLDRYNVSADISSTGGQMARGLGLALASKRYRENKRLPADQSFSDDGREVCFVTIGDASTSEGVFWETMNAAGVMQVPLAVSVWDDGYGISVPVEMQTTKGSISEALRGLEYDPDKKSGVRIHVARGWDYPHLVRLYRQRIEQMRRTHVPALFHITELTQPQGHSTSGSHERYKSAARLDWERAHDCLVKMEEWLLREGLATAPQLEAIKEDAREAAKAGRDAAWKLARGPVRRFNKALSALLPQLRAGESLDAPLAPLAEELARAFHPTLSELLQLARRVRFACLGHGGEAVARLTTLIDEYDAPLRTRYADHLYSDTARAALRVPVVAPTYGEEPKQVNGYQLLNRYFDAVFARYPQVYAFGEDVGRIGDVNQGFMNLQEKYGEARVFDTGIREWTIMGQGIGMAMRGLRPIAEIQYLDYLIYGLQPLTDDLATLRWRSNGQQAAPMIVRTRGHRLEGVWHAGSPLGMMIHSLRGMYLAVPRNMTQAAGIYNTLLQSDDPAIVVECLNGYRLKEALPDNLGTYTVPLGVPEVLTTGDDVTVVTYGSCVRIARAAEALLRTHGIGITLIDVQTLLPFDLEGHILRSLQRTNRILFLDEDVPGGATAYMLQQVLEKQGGYRYLDSAPQTLCARAHRTPYGSDGDYATKPQAEDVFRTVYDMVREAEPARLPTL